LKPRSKLLIVLGWYMYQALKTPMQGFPKDKVAVWGHDGWGLVMDNPYPQFKSARDFLNATKSEFAQRSGGRIPLAADNSGNRMRIGIDLGGTKIEAIALDDAGSTLLRRRVPTPAGDYTRILNAVADLVATAERN
jgi:hypothetical protein